MTNSLIKSGVYKVYRGAVLSGTFTDYGGACLHARSGQWVMLAPFATLTAQPKTKPRFIVRICSQRRRIGY
ncbi:hypothetical protein HMY34_16970 [Thiothrix subterranea]|uniref:hypothetical protein n=1 Tax=Thiothrix subterranea TaxID=2735563 RepID=UPI00192C8D28|nr:hypothetical protein [Thiothrix subterranea]QQZ30311.1 hypothetical protein HMY34_16970 [Thiothrix subterranea]